MSENVLSEGQTQVQFHSFSVICCPGALEAILRRSPMLLGFVSRELSFLIAKTVISNSQNCETKA